MDYLHGAYGEIQLAGTRVAAKSRGAIIYVGTAPVQTLAGGAGQVNRPILVSDMAEARKYLGYSDDWAKYTLCEAMHAHFENNAVGPLVMINVLDPAAHKSESGGTVSLTPSNGQVMIANAEDIVLDSVKVAGKQAGTDFRVQYSPARKSLTISELKPGALGTEALSVSYDSVDASKVKAADVIGQTDGAGLNTGLFALNNVYQETGFIPSFLLAPGFSSITEVHAAMVQNARKINGHWDAYLLTDLPIVDEKTTRLTLATAAEWKNTHGYNQTNETVYFPMAQGTDGRIYHLSVLAAANLQTLLVEQDGIPFKTASNTECGIIKNLYLGEDSAGRVYDDTLINATLNANGIASAAYVSGRWAIWGYHSADYSAQNSDLINISETNRMMLYHISNDFQHRRGRDVDKPLSKNDLKTIVSEEQTRLDALVKIGALTHGQAALDANPDNLSDMISGDYTFAFNITTTPMAKSMTALVNWTDAGFVTYFADFK